MDDTSDYVTSERFLGLITTYQVIVAAVITGSAYVLAYCYEAGWRMTLQVPMETSIHFGKYLFPTVFAVTLVLATHAGLHTARLLEKAEQHLPNKWFVSVSLAVLACCGLILVRFGPRLGQYLDVIWLCLIIAVGYGAGHGVLHSAWGLGRRLLCCGALAVALMVGTVFIGGFIGSRQTAWTVVELQGVEYLLFDKQGDRLLVAPFSKENDNYEPRFRVLPLSEDITLYRYNVTKLHRSALSDPSTP